MNETDQKFDLLERTSVFAEECIKFCKTIPLNVITKPIIIQLVRSSTSIGANYCEANNAESRKDFRHKIGICKKESKETMYWLRILCTAVPNQKLQAEKLRKEADELNLIFNAIWNKLDINLNV